MSSYGTAVAAVATLIVPLIGLQTFWIARMLDRVNRRIDRIDTHLDRIEDLLRGHDQRIARLEAR
jgi:hypothetical protein